MGLFNTVRMGASGAGDAYEISRSLRFDDNDSPRLNFTASSAGNRQKWTKSFWLKRGQLMRVFLTAYYISGADVAAIELQDNHALAFYDYYNGYRLHLVTTQKFTDPTAWMHVVINIDTTQSTSSERAKIYINGERVTSFSTEKLLENYNYFIESVKKEKPDTIKGEFYKNIYVSSTMGISYKVGA